MQNVVDAVEAISQRLKYHSILVILCVCFTGYLIQVPVIKNGGFLLFVDIEYFTTAFMIPSIVLVEVSISHQSLIYTSQEFVTMNYIKMHVYVMLQIGAIVFIYKPYRIVDHAEQMNVINGYLIRVMISVGMYVSFFTLLVRKCMSVFMFLEMKSLRVVDNLRNEM